MTNIANKPANKRRRRMTDDTPPDAGQPQNNNASAATPKEAPAKQTKASLILDLLSRRQGATLDQMVAATGWLPHTARAALSGLKKKDHTIERRKVDGQTIYFRV